jgi:hypothetical protein
MEAFVTWRERILKEYDSKHLVFRATTRPYKSKLSFVWSVVDPRPAVAPTVAFAVLRKGQELEYFGYGLGAAIPVTPNQTKASGATDADTNQGDARNTNGVEDFVIESISASSSGVRVQYSPTDTQIVALGLTDPDVIAAYAGLRGIVDPGTLIAPPQATSPFNLEDAMFEGLKAVASVRFQWDRAGFIPIGTLDQIPEGGARSFLRASGDPRTDNRYKIPEGYAWRRKSMPDADFVTNVRISDTVVCPINLIAPAGQGATASVPINIMQDVILRVHGLGLSSLGENAGA